MYSIFVNADLFILEREKKREREREGGRERKLGRDREKGRQRIPNRIPSVGTELNVGLDAMNSEIMPALKPRDGHLAD